ncbi:hypothetical protein [Lentzea flava]|uniref:hypothetical protein n=1 Tax=Lentzea flava TaxID=103732 RepID=UPI001E559D75|nr:hypothetical protein [Lentzea flava]
MCASGRSQHVTSTASTSRPSARGSDTAVRVVRNRSKYTPALGQCGVAAAVPAAMLTGE